MLRAFGCLIEHSSVSDAELVARLWLQLLSKPILRYCILLFSALFYRQLVIMFATAKGTKTSQLLLYYTSVLYPHLISAESRHSEHQAENDSDFEICL